MFRKLAERFPRLARCVAFARGKLRSGAVIIVMAVLGAAAAHLHGDPDYNLQGFVMAFYRLSMLLLWVWFSGWVLDLANGVSFGKDRKLIEEGNLAVAVSRSAGYAALVIAGAMLIAKV
jgi:hypothetical protein